MLLADLKKNEGGPRVGAPHTDHVLELIATGHEHARALHVDDPAALEIAQKPRHSLPRRPDHLCDLLMRQDDLQADALRRLLAAAVAPVEKQLCQLLRRRLRESERPDLALRGGILLADRPAEVHTPVGVAIQALQELVA